MRAKYPLKILDMSRNFCLAPARASNIPSPKHFLHQTPSPFLFIRFLLKTTTKKWKIQTQQQNFIHHIFEQHRSFCSCAALTFRNSFSWQCMTPPTKGHNAWSTWSFDLMSHTDNDGFLIDDAEWCEWMRLLCVLVLVFAPKSWIPHFTHHSYHNCASRFAANLHVVFFFGCGAHGKNSKHKTTTKALLQ